MVEFVLEHRRLRTFTAFPQGEPIAGAQVEKGGEGWVPQWEEEFGTLTFDF